MNKIYLQILDKFSSGHDLVLATVTGKIGSTPQEPGSSALFGNKGLLAGTVGGGVVEARVQQIAGELAGSGKCGHYNFNLANDISKKEEAICGGQISILIDASIRDSMDVFRELRQSVSEYIGGILLTELTINNGIPLSVKRFWITDPSKMPFTNVYSDEIWPVVKSLLAGGTRSEYTKMEFAFPGEMSSTLFLLEPVFPPEHLVIAGAGHIGRSLAHLGKLLGFEITVIDDRPEFANAGNIPDADHLVVDNIEKAVGELRKTPRTYIVIVSRGHKDDAGALRSCIEDNHAYIGMIGSRSKVAAMKRDFIENGWATESQWEKIHAPVGLDIGSQTVDEIAVSIAAELILVRSRKKTSTLV